MSLSDLFRQVEIDQLREEADQIRRRHAAFVPDTSHLKELADENLELRLRVALLIRLLIAKGVFTAEEFAALLAETRKPL